jgi:CubicO group peptidase (beta-lactamase class C family)
VLSFFPEFTPGAGETTTQRVTIEHLLTMTAPYKYGVEPYEQFFASEDPVKDALNYLGGNKPIGEFNYSAIGGTHILSAILTRAVGMPVLDYAKMHLFRPLDIDVPDNIALRSAEEHMRVMNDKRTRGWVVDPKGRNTASWGLFLTVRDMAKIGQLYLNHGVWHGGRIVPERWVAQSTAMQSRFGDLGYGYLWWVIDEEERCFAAMGDGGNVIYVNGSRNLVVAIAATFAPAVNDRIALVKEHIVPCFS